MTCSQCWAAVPAGSQKCPRCGAKMTGAPPSFLGLLKSYPWLIVLLSLSVIVTLWAATRRAPVPEPIPRAVEPVVAAPAPEPEPEVAAPPVFVPAPAPEPAPETAAPAPAAVQRPEGGAPPPPASSVEQQSDGTWRSGSANPGRR